MVLSEHDILAAFAYRDGLMSGEEQFAFEVRLSEEPKLAQAVEEFLSTDVVLRATAAQRRPYLRSLAAAAVILAVLASGMAFLISRASSQEEAFCVAVLPGDPTLEIYNSRFERASGLVPPGMQTRSDGQTSPNVGAEEYVELMEGLESDRFEEYLPRAAEPVEAGLFLVAFSTATECSAVLLRVAEGSTARLYPTEDDPWTEPARFTSGIHFLPSVPVSVVKGKGDETPWVDYRRPFLLPRAEEEWWLLLALRREPFGRPLLEELDRVSRTAGRTRADAAAELAAWLEDHGFQVETRVVQEPAK